MIAGYGQRQDFPELFDLHTDGIVAGKLKWRVNGRGGITHRNGAMVVPFAQTDMVYLFMEGVDRGYQAFLQKSVPDLIAKIGGSIIDAYVKGNRRQLDKIKAGLTQTKAIRKMLDDFWTKEAAGYRRKAVSRDIITVVQSLPKSDLADLAEALVNLTSTKRQVTPQQETVGGPVDVAVISKGDGFIWIKRKHYFDAELNQHFLQKYYRN